MQRMRRPAVHRTAGCNQRLADHLSAEYPLPRRLRRAGAKHVHFELFEIKQREKVLDSGHAGLA